MSQDQKIRLAKSHSIAIDPKFMTDFHHVNLEPCECNKDLKQGENPDGEQYARTVCENPDGEHLIGTVVQSAKGLQLVVKVRKGDELRHGWESPYWDVAPDLQLVYDEKAGLDLWNGSRQTSRIALFMAVIEWQEKRPQEKVLHFGGAEYFFRFDPLLREDQICLHTVCSDINHIAVVLSKFQGPR